uniref:Putative hemolymph juvenile hormone binding protein jhbp n=1 Tax=Haematobia irritans TaxID=7368 RepID=A0A1L8EHU1_HAEIR
MKLQLTILCAILFVNSQIQMIRAVEMPDFIKVCSRNDPKINECIKNTVHAMRPHLKGGIKDLNVPAMEPLYIGDLNILEGGGAGINVKAIDLNIYGASNFEIKKLKNSNNGMRYDFELNLPRLQGEGKYDINGQILTLPLRGNGPFTGNFTNFYAFVKVIFDTKTINSEEYLQIKDLEVRIRTGKGRIRLENLFNGDKALGDVVNDTINQNFEVFTNELIGPIEKALEKKFIAIARKILENFTYNELFPV